VLKLRQGDGPPAEMLVIANPANQSVIPGGAPPDIMRAYVFLSSNVLYPSPGCWEFTVRIGEEATRIVRDLKPAAGFEVKCSFLSATTPMRSCICRRGPRGRDDIVEGHVDSRRRSFARPLTSATGCRSSPPSACSLPKCWWSMVVRRDHVVDSLEVSAPC
jgi:hypothetical protein